VTKTTFQWSCDQLCVKRFLIHLEGLLDWIIPHQVRRNGSYGQWKWSLAYHAASIWANVAQRWVFTSQCNGCCRSIAPSAMLVCSFGTSTCFPIFELIKFMCFVSTFSYSHKEFFNPRPHRTRTHSLTGYCTHSANAGTGYLQPARDNRFAQNTILQSSW